MKRFICLIIVCVLITSCQINVSFGDPSENKENSKSEQTDKVLDTVQVYNPYSEPALNGHKHNFSTLFYSSTYQNINRKLYSNHIAFVMQGKIYVCQTYLEKGTNWSLYDHIGFGITDYSANSNYITFNKKGKYNGCEVSDGDILRIWVDGHPASPFNNYDNSMCCIALCLDCDDTNFYFYNCPYCKNHFIDLNDIAECPFCKRQLSSNISRFDAK